MTRRKKGQQEGREGKGGAAEAAAAEGQDGAAGAAGAAEEARPEPAAPPEAEPVTEPAESMTEPAGPEARDDAGTAAAEAQPAEAGAEPATPPEQIVEELQRELDELRDRYLRLVAEFDNFRKRTMRERAYQEERAQADLVKQLLESLDDLARVSEHGSEQHDTAAILEGVRLVEAKLRRALEACGLKPIEAVGRTFDPELHEAVVTVDTDRPDENEVVSQELAKGYLFKDTLLRPALVEVKVYRPEPESGSGSEGAGPDETEGRS